MCHLSLTKINPSVSLRVWPICIIFRSLWEIITNICRSFQINLTKQYESRANWKAMWRQVDICLINHRSSWVQIKATHRPILHHFQELNLAQVWIVALIMYYHPLLIWLPQSKCLINHCHGLVALIEW